MARIFLSYAREDAGETADSLRTKLGLAGHIVWRDIEDMRGGVSWKDQIRRQIEAVHCIIVLLTPNGVESLNVEYEWRTAFELNKRVLPILIHPCEVPPELSQLHYHPANDDESYQRMLLVLLRDLGDIDKQFYVQQPAANDLPAELITYVQDAIKAYSERLQDLLKLGTTKIPPQPYKELYAFELIDEQIFFGRDTDSKRLQRTVLVDRIAVLHARSGAGKTSVINAGLMPRLITAGYIPIYARAHTDPVEAIKRVITSALPYKSPVELSKLSLHQFLRISEVALGTQSREIVIILDQFEEFFVLYPQPEQRQPFINAIAECYEDLTLRARFVLSLRKDYFSDLSEFQERLPSIFINEFRLPNLTRDQAMDAILGPMQLVDSAISYEDDLLIELLDDLDASGMELPHLQIICSQLYEECDENQTVITLKDYQNYGRAPGILGNYLNRTLLSFPKDERNLADELLFELVSSQSTKRILERESLIKAVHAPEVLVDKVLGQLVDARLLRRDRDTEENRTFYEMAHEYLVAEIERRAASDPNKIATKQIKETLQRAVIEWRTSGILMSRPMLERVYQLRESLGALTDMELACVILSSIQENHYEIAYWITHDSQRSLTLLEPLILDQKLDDRQRGRMIVSLRYMGKEAVPFLARLTRQRDEAVQRAAMRVLENLKQFDLAYKGQDWYSLYHDRDHYKEIAAKNLAKTATSDDTQALIAAFEAEAADEVKANLLYALRRAGTPEGLKLVDEHANLIASYEDLVKQQEAQLKEEKLKEAQSTEQKSIEKSLEGEKLRQQRLIAEADRYLNRNEGTIDYFISQFEHHDKFVRQRAVERLVSLYGSRALPQLIEALKAERWRKRYRSAQALGLIGNRAASPALIKAMSDRFGEVRCRATEALGLMRDRSAIPVLTKALNDTAYDIGLGKRVSEVAREALTRIGKAEKLSVSPMPDLYQVLTSTDESAILKAINSIILKEITPTDRVKDLLKLIAETPPELSRSKEVRLAAQRAVAVLNTTK